MLSIDKIISRFKDSELSLFQLFKTVLQLTLLFINLVSS